MHTNPLTSCLSALRAHDDEAALLSRSLSAAEAQTGEAQAQAQGATRDRAVSCHMPRTRPAHESLTPTTTSTQTLEAQLEEASRQRGEAVRDLDEAVQRLERISAERSAAYDQVTALNARVTELNFKVERVHRSSCTQNGACHHLTTHALAV